MAQELGSGLTGVYLFGSAALGDYRPPRSDLDVAVVAGRSLAYPEKERLACALDHRALPCPARKLELVVYERGRLSRGDVAFELDLNTGPDVHEWHTDPAGASNHWYVLDVAIGRARGIALSGPPPEAVFAEQDRGQILAAVRESLDWHLDHADDAAVDPGDVILNACRAWRWLEEDEWSAKGAAGRWAAARGRVRDAGRLVDDMEQQLDPRHLDECDAAPAGASGIVGLALAHRAGDGPPPEVSDARRFAREVLERAAGPPQG